MPHAQTAANTLLPVEPGLFLLLEQERIATEVYIADLQAEADAAATAMVGKSARIAARAQVKIANIQAEISRAQLDQDRIHFELNLAQQQEEFGLTREQFEEAQHQFAEQFGLSQAQFEESKRQFESDFSLRADEFEESQRQFDADLDLRREGLGLETARLAQEKEQFAQQFGLTREQFEQAIEEFNQTFGLAERGQEQEEFEFEQQFGLEQERFGLERDIAEAELAANPANFVALELYKRAIEGQGGAVPGAGGAAVGDPGIQDLFSQVLDLGGAESQGTGQFGVQIPTPGSISRSQFQQFTGSDIGLLESFLNAGVDVGGGEFAGINPEDFFQEVQEGFIPTVRRQGPAEVRF